MYPNLVVPLLAMLGLLLAVVVVLTARQPVSRRLAFRQLARRRAEAALAVIGCTLGTAIIIGALVVGDTLNFSVRQVAYQTLGPIDERVLSSSTTIGDQVAQALRPLVADRDVDGVLSGYVDQSAALAAGRHGTLAEPQVLVWDLDLSAAGQFGSAAGPSGLSGPNPGAGQAVVNAALADALGLHAGSTVTLYLYGSPRPFTVARVVPAQGVAGAGLGATVNRDAFLAPGVLAAAARAAGHSPQAFTFVSNRGGVEAGALLTAPVLTAMRSALGPLAGHAIIDGPKKSVLDNATQTGNALGALFLMIGSFSIIAGALLLVNIFVMLADERKSQLGMLRAVGMTRRRLVGSFAVEGTTYALASTVLAVFLGLGIGRAVAAIAARIFQGQSANGTGLTIRFAVTPTSIVNGCALGLVIACSTILLTSVRISRFNVIAAIRDLPSTSAPRARRRRLVASTAAAVVVAAVAVPEVVRSQAVATYVLPSLAAVLLLPLLERVIGRRWSITAVAGAVMIWTLIANIARPRIFDTPSMAVYVVLGSLVAFSAVTVVSQNQLVLLAPLRRLFARPSQTGLATRLAVAYPLAKRFRTGATLVMYTLITLVLVLLVQITGVINAGIAKGVANATGGYALRVDLNPTQANATLAAIQTGRYAGDVNGVVPLLSATALAADPGRRSATPLHAVVVGVPAGSMRTVTFSSRLSGLSTNGAVWDLIAADPRYVALDAFFGATGGPQGKFYAPGDRFRITDPASGRTAEKIIAGILTSGLIFYPASVSGSNAYPVVTSYSSVSTTFGSDAAVTAAFLHTRAGVDATALATALQGSYLSASLVATSLAANMRRVFAANIQFFQLMQGFLGLGLLVGITGLGVAMVRAVRERRRTIGVLRALGFRARTVALSFLAESGLIAGEGIVLGSVLGVVTTWLMYQNSAAFGGIKAGYPLQWVTVGVLAVVTLVASLLATVGPARRAAMVEPALAVRVDT